jgi:hypothetical protein
MSLYRSSQPCVWCSLHHSIRCHGYLIILFVYTCNLLQFATRCLFVSPSRSLSHCMLLMGRLLIAGDYEIVCEAPGYRSRNIALSLPAWREPLNLSSTEHYLFLPIRLDPLTHPSTVAVDILRVDLQIFVVGFISLLIVFGLIFLLLAKLWRKNSKRAIAYTLSEVESNV